MKTRVEADKLFTELDGTNVSAGGSDWLVRVFSVIDEPHHRWLQVVLEGASRPVLTLRLNQTEGSRQVVRQLCTWLNDPSSTRNVLQRVA